MLVVWILMYKKEITASLREIFLGHRTYHTTSWSHRVTFTWPPGVLLTNNSYLRIAFVCSVGQTRCIHDGYTRASRSRVAVLTQLVNFVCSSCCPSARFGSHRVAFRSNRDAFGWKLFCYHLQEKLRAKLEISCSCVHRESKSGQCDSSINI